MVVVVLSTYPSVLTSSPPPLGAFPRPCSLHIRWWIEGCRPLDIRWRIEGHRPLDIRRRIEALCSSSVLCTARLIVVQLLSRVWLCDPMDCSAPGFPVLLHLQEFALTHVHWVRDAIQSSHPLLPPSPPALNLFQHQGHFQWVSSSHQVAKVLELQLQHQSFQWIFRVDFL